MNGVTTNKSTIVVITTAVAIMAFACVSTICLLSYFAIQIPPELNTLAGTLSGGLAGMLVKTSPTETTKAPTPTGGPGEPPTKTTVENQPENPVPTTESKP